MAAPARGAGGEVAGDAGSVFADAMGMFSIGGVVASTFGAAARTAGEGPWRGDVGVRDSGCCLNLSIWDCNSSIRTAYYKQGLSKKCEGCTQAMQAATPSSMLTRGWQSAPTSTTPPLAICSCTKLSKSLISLSSPS